MRKLQPDPPLDKRLESIANNPNLNLMEWMRDDLTLAAEELVRVRQLPETEWAMTKANIMSRLAILSRRGDVELAQDIRAQLDHGSTYVSRLLHRLDSTIQALEESLALNENFASVVEPDILEHLSEYKDVIKQANRALYRNKNV